MLQQDEPGDYVIATGRTHSVRELLEIAFGHVELDYRKHVEIDPALLRPAEVHHLKGDNHKGTSHICMGTESDLRTAGGDDGGQRSGTGEARGIRTAPAIV